MSELHALLIGIDDYFPDRLPDGTRCPSLHGATRDVSRMALVLRDHAGLQPENTRMLLSRAGEDGGPAEPPERRPTYPNIVAAFEQLAVEAAPGDRIYIHYSGHGARVPTDYPEIKGRTGRDEAFVPCDIGEPGSRYLRDLELAVLVQLLVERRLVVTLVLDCCHAGGAMRGGKPKAVPRRMLHVRQDEAPSLLAKREVLVDLGRKLFAQPSFRGLTLQSWVPVAREYALFAACRPDETAFEYPFEKGEPQGALTCSLLHTLRRYGIGLSCGEIHQRLLARVRGKLPSQTPVFLGDGDRLFLEAGRVEVPARRAPGVIRAQDGRGILLDVGQALGIKAGDRFRAATGTVLEIHKVGATESWAQIVHTLGPETFEPGDRVDFLPLQATVHLLAHEPADPSTAQALDGLRETLRTSRNGFVTIADNGAAADFQIAVERGAYVVLDAASTSFPNLSPVPVDGSEAAQKIVRRLHHLARFRNILAVENPRPASWLRIGLDLYEDDPARAQEPRTTRMLDLNAGDAVIFRIVNRSRLRLDFTVLDLAPDYGVTQLLPGPGSFSALSLDPGASETVRVKAWLPQGFEAGTDILKVFATQNAASFRWLELPPLDRPVSNLRGEPKTPLERLFAQLAARRQAMRSGLTPSEFPEEEWITAQVEIRVRR